jgi:hypothetical protein
MLTTTHLTNGTVYLNRAVPRVEVTDLATPLWHATSTQGRGVNNDGQKIKGRSDRGYRRLHGGPLPNPIAGLCSGSQSKNVQLSMRISAAFIIIIN